MLVPHSAVGKRSALTCSCAGDAVRIPSQPWTVAEASKDFELRNLLVTIASRDDWFYAEKVPTTQAETGLLAENDIKLYTMDIADHPEYLCVKAYLKFKLPPDRMAELLWDPERPWDPLHSGGASASVRDDRSVLSMHSLLLRCRRE